MFELIGYFFVFYFIVGGFVACCFAKGLRKIDGIGTRGQMEWYAWIILAGLWPIIVYSELADV